MVSLCPIVCTSLIRADSEAHADLLALIDVYCDSQRGASDAAAAAEVTALAQPTSTNSMRVGRVFAFLFEEPDSPACAPATIAPTACFGTS